MTSTVKIADIISTSTNVIVDIFDYHSDSESTVLTRRNALMDIYHVITMLTAAG